MLRGPFVWRKSRTIEPTKIALTTTETRKLKFALCQKRQRVVNECCAKPGPVSTTRSAVTAFNIYNIRFRRGLFYRVRSITDNILRYHGGITNNTITDSGNILVIVATRSIVDNTIVTTRKNSIRFFSKSQPSNRRITFTTFYRNNAEFIRFYNFDLSFRRVRSGFDKTGEPFPGFAYRHRAVIFAFTRGSSTENASHILIKIHKICHKHDKFLFYIITVEKFEEYL